MTAQPVRRAQLHQTTRYAVDVVDGRVVTGRPVLWACQRHLDDLEHGEKRAGFWFDEEAADHFFDFVSLVNFVEGERDGQPFELEGWQQFALGSLFGWMKDDGSRRFWQAWIRVARGNGKSPLGALVGNYMTGFDGEARAQCFTAATKRQQARIIHETALIQVRRSPHLAAIFKERRDRLYVPDTNSYFVPLGQDSKTEDGLNPHCAILDEVHAHPNGGMWDVLASAMVKRRQPILFAITTAGYGANTFGRQMDDHFRAIVDPSQEASNDNAFVFIAELDEGDDKYDERNWVKANPNIGVSVYLDKMRQRAAEAQQSSRIEEDFFCKNLNAWVSAQHRWLPMEKWDAAALGLPKPTPEAMRGRPCYGGLDMATTSDTVAFLRYFPATARHPVPAVIADFWLPSERVATRLKFDHVDYKDFIEKGARLKTVKGLYVDPLVVHQDIRAMHRETPFELVFCDPTDAQAIISLLKQDGIRVQPFAQSHRNYNAPTQELERLVHSPLAHGADPMLRWHLSNVVLAVNDDGEIMPSKGKSSEKIDGATAFIEAIAAAATRPVEPPPGPITHHTLSARDRHGSRVGGKREILNAFGPRRR